MCQNVNSQAAIQTLDDTVLDVDQVESLSKYCPTKEEMELLKVRLKKAPSTPYVLLLQLIEDFCFCNPI